jgi:hypothetical protein
MTEREVKDRNDSLTKEEKASAEGLSQKELLDLYKIAVEKIIWLDKY